MSWNQIVRAYDRSFLRTGARNWKGTKEQQAVVLRVADQIFGGAHSDSCKTHTHLQRHTFT